MFDQMELKTPARGRREEEIFMMASYLKGPFSLIEAEMGESNWDLSDALRAFEKLSATDDSSIEFQKIVRSLPDAKLECLGEFLRLEGEKKVKDSGAGGGFLMSAATMGIASIATKFLSERLCGVFDPKSVKWAKPYEDAIIGGGVVLVMAGVLLQEKKPGLSKFMVKVGALAIAFDVLIPLAMALSPAIGSVFGALLVGVLVYTAAYA